MALTREELFAKYGQPAAAGSKGELYYFRHDSRESAEAYVAANYYHYGYPGWIEPAGDFWLSVVDIGPAIARMTAEFRMAKSAS